MYHAFLWRSKPSQRRPEFATRTEGSVTARAAFTTFKSSTSTTFFATKRTKDEIFEYAKSLFAHRVMKNDILSARIARRKIWFDKKVLKVLTNCEKWSFQANACSRAPLPMIATVLLILEGRFCGAKSSALSADITRSLIDEY